MAWSLVAVGAEFLGALVAPGAEVLGARGWLPKVGHRMFQVLVLLSLVSWGEFKVDCPLVSSAALQVPIQCLLQWMAGIGLVTRHLR